MTKYAGRGLTISVGTSGNTVGQVVSGLEGAGSTRGLTDASAYGDDWTDWVSGQQDGSTMDLVIAYDPDDDDQNSLVSTYDGGAPEDFWLDHDEAGFHVTFPALLTACTRGGPRDGLLSLAITLKILNPGVSDVASS